MESSEIGLTSEMESEYKSSTNWELRPEARPEFIHFIHLFHRFSQKRNTMVETQ